MANTGSNLHMKLCSKTEEEGSQDETVRSDLAYKNSEMISRRQFYFLS